MSDGSRQAPGRRATDRATFVDELTRTLADVEKANNLLRCHVQDLKAEIRAAKDQALLASTATAKEIAQLRAQIDHEQALRRKAEATVYGRQLIKNTERTS